MDPLPIASRRDYRFAFPPEEARAQRAQHPVFDLIREAAAASPELRLHQAVDRYILGILLQVAGNRSTVSAWWGVSNKTLYNKWRRYWPAVFGAGARPRWH